MLEPLDDLPGMGAVDHSNLLAQLTSFPHQIEWSKEVTFPELPGVDNVVICGVGGSAIAGDVIIDLLSPSISVPVVVSRDVVLPGFAGKGTLAVVVSYSGNTAESLEQYRDALRRGCRVAAVTSGGRLEEFAIADSIPLIKVPAGNQPRASLGYMLSALALVFQRAGLGQLHDALQRAVPNLRSYIASIAPDVPYGVNQAKRLAKAMAGGVVVVYAPRQVRSVALRWQNQLNENAKAVAFSGEVPEMDHNQLVGWLEGGKGCPCRPLMLMPSDMRPTVRRMSEVTLQMLNERGLDPVLVTLPDEGLLENILHGIALGDMASYYLAILRGVDPAPVVSITEFKGRIAP